MSSNARATESNVEKSNSAKDDCLSLYAKKNFRHRDAGSVQRDYLYAKIFKWKHQFPSCKNTKQHSLNLSANVP